MSAKLGGSVGLAKSGGGSATLSGANTYSGTTNVDGGTLTLSGGSAIADSNAVAIAAAATLSVTSNETIGSIAAVSGSFITLGNISLVVGGANASTTIASVISGTGSLNKQGTGTLTLGGANTYSGTTTVSAGTLALSGGAAIGNLSVVSIGSAGILDLNGYDEGIAALAGQGSVHLGDKTLTIGGLADATYSGVISGLGGKLIKTGSGSQTLSGTNTFDGQTTIAGGTLALGSNNVLVGPVRVSGGAFALGNFSDTVTAVTLASGSITGSGTLTSDSAFDIQSGSVSAKLAGAAGMNKSTSATATLSGANSFTGTTAISGGKLTLTGGSALADGVAVTVASGATLEVSLAETIGNLSGAASSSVRLTGSLTTGGATDSIFSGVISGAGSLTKYGSGVLTLGGANTFSGTTFITAGVVRLAGGAALNDGSIVQLSNTAGATLDLNGTNETIGLLQGGGSNGGNISLGSATLTVGTSLSTVFNGAISGSGGVTKIGAGTLTLGGHSTFTGTLLVSAGAVAVSVSNAIVGNVIVDGGSFSIGVNSLTVASLTLNSGTISGSSGALSSTSTIIVRAGMIAARLGGTGGLTKLGAGSVVLAADNAYVGITRVEAGLLRIDGAQTLSDVVVAGGVLGGAGTVGDVLVAGGAISPGNSPGRLTVSGSLTFLSGVDVVDINGSGDPGVDYDQIVANGPIDLTGAQIALNLGYSPAVGTTLTIIRNDGIGATTGGFANAIAGWTVSYVGGDGNDVTLTFVGILSPPPPAPPSIPVNIVLPGQNPTAGSPVNGASVVNAPTDGGLLVDLLSLVAPSLDRGLGSFTGGVATGLLSDLGFSGFSSVTNITQRQGTFNGAAPFNALHREVEGALADLRSGEGWSQTLAPVAGRLAQAIADGIASGSSSDSLTEELSLRFPQLERTELTKVVQASTTRAAFQRVSTAVANGPFSRSGGEQLLRSLLRDFPGLDRARARQMIQQATQDAQKKFPEAPAPPKSPAEAEAAPSDLNSSVDFLPQAVVVAGHDDRPALREADAANYRTNSAEGVDPVDELFQLVKILFAAPDSSADAA